MKFLLLNLLVVASILGCKIKEDALIGQQANAGLNVGDTLFFEKIFVGYAKDDIDTNKYALLDSIAKALSHNYCYTIINREYLFKGKIRGSKDPKGRFLANYFVNSRPSLYHKFSTFKNIIDDYGLEKKPHLLREVEGFYIAVDSLCPGIIEKKESNIIIIKE